MSISQETYAETLARAMANPVHSKGCGCKRCKDRANWPKGWTQRDEDSMNVRDELLLLMVRNRTTA